MQHGRGNIFPRHALPRGNCGIQAQHQAAGLRLRRRSGRDRKCQGRLVSGDDRGGCITCATRPVLFKGRSQLSRVAGAAGVGGLHGAGFAGRSAILPPGSDILPEPADLPGCRGTGKSCVAVPFRAAPGRHSPAWQLGNDRPRRSPVRGDFQAGAALSAHRSQPSRRTRPAAKRQRRRAHFGSARAGPAAFAPGRSCRAMPAAGDGELHAGSGADQPQARVSVLDRTNRSLFARGAGTPHARSPLHGPPGHSQQTPLSAAAGMSAERPHCRPGRTDNA